MDIQSRTVPKVSEMQPRKAKACTHLNISSYANVDFLWRLFHPADPSVFISGLSHTSSENNYPSRLSGLEWTVLALETTRWRTSTHTTTKAGAAEWLEYLDAKAKSSGKASLSLSLGLDAALCTVMHVALLKLCSKQSTQATGPRRQAYFGWCSGGVMNGLCSPPLLAAVSHGNTFLPGWGTLVLLTSVYRTCQFQSVWKSVSDRFKIGKLACESEN